MKTQTQNRQKKLISYPSWFDHTPNTKSIEHFKDAAVNYILDKKLRKKLPKPDIDTVKAMLKWVGPFERRWMDVTIDNFNTGRHKAHLGCYQTIINLLNSREELIKRLDIADGSMEAIQEAEQAESSQNDEEEEEEKLDEPNQQLDNELKTLVPPDLPGSSEHQSTKEFTPENIRKALKRVKA